MIIKPPFHDVTCNMTWWFDTSRVMFVIIIEESRHVMNDYRSKMPCTEQISKHVMQVVTYEQDFLRRACSFVRPIADLLGYFTYFAIIIKSVALIWFTDIFPS